MAFNRGKGKAAGDDSENRSIIKIGMMINKDDELKEFFKRSAPQEEYSFDPKAWEKMHATLKAERKNKRIGFLIYLNALLLSLGLVTLGLLFSNDSVAGENTLIANKKEKALQQKNTTSTEVNNKPNLNKAADSVENTELNKSKKENKLVKEEKNIPTEKQADLSSVRYIKELRAGRIEIILKQIFSPLPADTKIEEEKEFESNSDLKSEMAVAKTPSEKNTPKDPLPLNSINELENLKKDSLNSEVKNNPVAKADTAKQEEESPENLKPVALKKDSLQAVHVAPRDSMRPKLNPKKILSVEVGGDYLLGWKNAGKTDAKGFNPIVGLNYFNGITNKLGVSVGVQYTTVNNLKETSHSSTATKLKFGEEVEVTTISARKMHYLVAPFKLHYAFNENNSFGIGYNLGYLLDVKSDIETYNRRFNQNTNEARKTGMGYRTGFSDFDGQLAFCYNRRIYKDLGLCSEFFYGLKDIKNNSVYKTQFFERNSGFKLTLTYNLFTK